ncbi:MAG: proteasome lid subunit RPN8/RPN11 [Saprospiraceae bacterium]|jgi:proteasome lid subunit RPN8/RPN11
MIIIEPVVSMTLHDEMLGDQPVYAVSDVDDIQDIYEYRIANQLTEDGVNDDFYFLADCSTLGLESNDKKFVDLSNIVNTPIFYKAYYHDVGNFFEPVNPVDIGLTSSIENIRGSSFTLPKISASIVSKVDAFLHAVHKKYTSEGIVLLTYDMDFLDAQNDEDGWGIAVPEQSNNAQHCDYDKASIVQKLFGTSTKIVGTIHSHPNMPAYASTTDHDDQAGFDGLHITFGWKRVGMELQKEYHAELVRGNSFYKIDPKLVMDLEPRFQYEIQLDGSKTYVGPESVEKVMLFTGPDGEELMVPSDSMVETNKVTTLSGEVCLMENLEKLEYEIPFDEDEVVEMIGSVQKKVMTYGSYQGNYDKHSGGHKINSNKAIGSNGSVGGSGKARGPQQGLNDSYNQNDFYPKIFPSEVLVFPKLTNFPDPTNNVIFARITEIKVDGECPACESPFGFTLEEVIDRHQCFGCGIYYLIGDETFDEVDQHRSTAGYLPFEKIFKDNVPIVVWDVGKLSWETIRGDSKKTLA